MAFFKSGADLDVGIVNQYILNSYGQVSGAGQSSLGFFNPTGGLPTNPINGDKYISTATANGWIQDYIHVYDEEDDVWYSNDPLGGSIMWLTDTAEFRIWNDTTNIWETASVASGSSGRYIFTSNGNLIIPAGVTKINLTMWGGGGGGAGSVNAQYGSGGGSGAMVESYSHYIPSGGTITVIIGAGGAGGVSTNGSQGGNTSATIGTFTLTAYGGGGGLAGSTSGGGGGAGGAGGSPNGGLSSSIYPLKGPGGAISPGAEGEEGQEGDSSFNMFVAGGSGGYGNSAGPGGDGSNFLGHTGGVGASGPTLNGGGGAAGPGGAGGDGSFTNGSSASANSGAGGGGGASEFGFNSTGGNGGSGYVIIETF